MSQCPCVSLELENDDDNLPLLEPEELDAETGGPGFDNGRADADAANC